jgi:hypothetical protein
MKLISPISILTPGTVQPGLDYGIASNERRAYEEKSFGAMGFAFESEVNCIDTTADYGDS